MKLLCTLIVLLACVSPLYSQGLVDPDRPITGIHLTSDTNQISIVVTYVTAASGPGCAESPFLTGVSWRSAEGASKNNEPGEPTGDPGEYRHRILFGTDKNDLSQNWKFLNFQVNYGCGKYDHFTPLFEVLHHVMGQSEIKLSNPVFFDEGTVQVTLTSQSDVFAAVQLKNGSGTVVGEQSLFLSMGKATPTNLKLEPGSSLVEGNDYTFETKPNDPSIPFQTHSYPWPSVQKTTVYKLTAPPKEQDLRATGTKWSLKVSTRCSGSLKMIFPQPIHPGATSEEFPENTGGDGVNHTFEIDLLGATEGLHPFYFDGAGATGTCKPLDLSSTRYTLINSPAGLSGPLDIGLSSDNKTLNIYFHLTKSVETSVTVNGISKSDKPVPIYRAVRNTTPDSAKCGTDLNTCYFYPIPLAQVTKLVTDTDDLKTGTGLITIQARQTSNDTWATLSNLSLQAVSTSASTTLTDELSKAATAYASSKDESTLKASVANAVQKAFPTASTTTPSNISQQAVIEYLVNQIKGSKGKGSSVLISILSTVGRVAAAYFGIPVPASTATP